MTYRILCSVLLLATFDLTISFQIDGNFPQAAAIHSYKQLNPLNEERETEEILRRADQNIQKHYLYLRNSFFASNPRDDEIAEQKFRKFKAELALNLSRFNYETFEHAGLKRRVKRLSKLQLEGLPQHQYENAIKLLKQIQSFAIQEINNVDYTSKVSYQQIVLRKIQSSTNSDELLYYWKEWRKTISENARRNLDEYRNYYRKAATLNGHITPSKTWYVYYEDDDFLAKLTKVMEDLMPLYKQLHAYIRHSIKEKYESKVPFHGPIPHHFLEQIMEQDWYSKSAFTVPYPYNTLPDVNIVLNQKLRNSTGLLYTAIWFYEQGLELPRFPPDFYENYAIPLTEQEAGIECKSKVAKFPPNYGIKYCPRLSFKKFLQMHQAIAKLEYYKESIYLPFGLNDEACPGFADAIGEAAVIAAGSPRHLDKMQVVANYTFNTELKMNRLFRMAVHTLFSVSQLFVHEYFWVNFLDQRITRDGMNCEYWRLQQKWVGVSPPEERDEETFDAGYRFYKGISDEKSFTRSLISEILGYQLYKAFCKVNEQYKLDDPINTLSTCDIFGSHKVGKAMSEMMSLGSQKHWHDVMEIMTKSRGLDASAMIEYYAPLYDWLKDYNKKHHIRAGWDSKEVCN